LIPSIKIALVDADVILYRCAFACQHTDYDVYSKSAEPAGRLAQFDNKTDLNRFLKELHEDEYVVSSNTYTESIEFALHTVKLMIESLKESVNADEYRLYLTGGWNFRHTALPSYKAGRAAKPLLYNDIRDYLVNHHNAIFCDGIEADDQLGIDQTQADHNTTVICSVDKDLLMIPGHHFNFIKNEWSYTDEARGSLLFDTQMLTGDRTDNICGVKGLGPVKAGKHLADRTHAERTQRIEELYEDYWGEGWEDVYECNSTLLWILREPLSTTN